MGETAGLADEQLQRLGVVLECMAVGALPVGAPRCVALLRVVRLGELGDVFAGMEEVDELAVGVLLGFLVLVIACVNYTNFATAQSLGRSREVGMRKTMGAGRRQLARQFLFESAAICLLGGLIGIGVASALTAGVRRSTYGVSLV